MAGAPFTTVDNTNAAPVVNAGADQSITLPATASLSGSYTDDGKSLLPVTTQWSKTSGPGTVTFGNAAALVTTAAFSQAGTYVLTLTANDGLLSGSDTMTVIVSGVSNVAPTVNAGPDQTITLPATSVTLAGTATDDGLPGGPLTIAWTKVSGPGTVTFGNAAAASTTATFSAQGSYVLQLSANDGALTSTDTATIAVNANGTNKALQLGGTNAYVTFGAAPGLGASQFTIETWFRRDGSGVATNTGTGGIVAVPLVTKGMAETEGSTVDANYFLGIRGSDNVLSADFEDIATGLNHPIAGTTVIPADGVWRHVAATYDGTTWRLYLNGALEASLVVGNFTPRFDSIQHFVLGSALNSTGVVTSGQTAGFFNGVLDEARVWNYARSAQQVSHGMTLEIASSTPGLLGRWGLNEGTGTTVGDSAPPPQNGTIVGSNFSWVAGAPFDIAGNTAPIATSDAATTTEGSATTIAVLPNDSDADGDALTVASVSAPAHGTASINANGTIAYVPAAGYSGGDSFTYSINDGQGGTSSATVSVTITNVNDAPVAANDSYSTNKNVTLTVSAAGVLANDTDADGDTLSAIGVVGPSHGSLSLNADGSFIYTPAANYSGADSFTYRANDGTADSNVATVSITVVNTNTAPVAVADTYTVNEDTVLNVAAPGVLGNDSDVDGDAMTALLVSVPSHGALTLNLNGSLSYTPAANYDGPDSFTYKVRAGAADSNIVTVSITVSAVNDAPAAVNDSYNASEDTALTIAAPGVLGNDTDVEGGALSASLVSGPAHGTLSLNGDGSFTYTPAANYNGADSFVYRASDGSANSNNATVSITVGAVNDAPVAVADSYSTNEDVTLTVAAPGALGNDTDADGDALSASVVAVPAHGTLTLNANGSFSYTPAANYNGADSFSYRASDGTLTSNVATVSISVLAVNDAPAAGNDSYSTPEDTVLTVSAPGVLGNDTDVEGSALTASVQTGPAHGTLTLNASGGFSYTPAANYNGADSFTYRANDGAASSALATVTISVIGANDAPVAAGDSYSVNEDATLTVAAPGVLGNDSDVDGDALSAAVVSLPAHGTVTLNANGSFGYVPAANYNGPDSFTYRVTDGSLDSNIATVSITVVAVNDAPVAVGDNYTTSEDTVLTLTAPGVLANDSDLEGNALTAVVVSGPSHGALTLNANGSLTYTPAANYNGPDSFSYKANDGSADSNTATVNITITAANDAPTANNDSFIAAEDTTAIVVAPGLLANDTDVDGNPLTAILVAGPSHGTVTLSANGSVTYQPATNYSGPDSFTYKANDGSLDSNVATVSISVTPVNDAPVAVGNSYSVNEDTALTVAAPGVLGNDSDVDGDALTAITVSGPSHGSVALSPNGSFVYTPTANYSGPDSFTYKARDGVLDSNVATVTITVNAVADAPVANNDSYAATEDTVLTIAAAGVLANDVDVDGNPMTAALVANAAHGTVTLNANGSFTYTPAANYNGPDSFTYRANDGTANSNTATVSLTVAAVNDAPASLIDSYSVNQDTVLTVAAPGVLANDTDVDSASLTAAVVAGPAHGTLSLNANGGFTYTPVTGYFGGDSFTYRVSDGFLNSNVATVTLTVNGTTLAVDKVVFSDGNNSRTTSAFSTAVPGELLVAFVQFDGPTTGGQTATVSGAGLTWTLVKRSNNQNGDSEIWAATATNQLTNVTVTAAQTLKTFQGSLTVVAFTGSAGIGASAIAGGSTGAAAVSLTTTKAKSLVYGTGNDWDKAVSRTLIAGQTSVHERLATAQGDTFWVQALGAPVATPGTVQVGTTAPLNSHWNFAAVEILSR